MPSFANEIDANFFNLIHQISIARQQKSETERRQSIRQPFLMTHRVAPLRTSSAPHESDFVEVQCHDLNQVGFSFLFPQEPDFDKLVVEFGSAENPIRMTAQVINSRNVWVDPTGLVECFDEGSEKDSLNRKMFILGCQFTQRVGDKNSPH